jgi:hypothetical protein
MDLSSQRESGGEKLVGKFPHKVKKGRKLQLSQARICEISF